MVRLHDAWEPRGMRRRERSPYFEAWLLIGSGLLVMLLLVLL